jgi:hypothetical protein
MSFISSENHTIIDQYIISVPALFYNKLFLDICFESKSLDFVGKEESGESGGTVTLILRFKLLYSQNNWNQ